MSPIIPSLLSRPLCGTLRKVPLGCIPSSITKTYFTPNGLRGGTHRPFFHHTFQPSLCNCPPPPTIPRPRRAFSHTSKRSFGTYTNAPLYFLKIGFSGVLLSLTFLAAPVIYCEPPIKNASSTAVSPPQPGAAAVSSSASPLPPPPQSTLNFYELTFGTVCGVCAGVFVKKGAKFVAFALGGVFVLLQYLGSWSLVRVDWNRAAGRFENLFYRKDASGVSRPPNVGSLFRWVIDFLTADFQPRASFVAGFALGLRVG
ncbi:FUN14 family-domain-containing protein [Dichomitus squalens]|uniref:FUN14 family-domain-containing protein n=1 Tax=Dichomitus squalens TaxID=114155 RepID=A0A4Q9N955_9APHY|nr:FUN14 family-domain-containing protein [Dichomitus squalens]